MKKLTIARTTYGVSEIPVVLFCYHDGGQLPTYEIYQGKVDIEVLDRIERAVQAGYQLEFEHHKGQ